MSRCNTCSKPGHCCKGFVLNIDLDRADPAGSAERALSNHGLGYMYYVEQFKADAISDLSGDAFEDETRIRGRFNCTRLGDDGRCTVYAQRPQLCRSYQPLHDGLCVEHVTHKPVIWLEVAHVD